jgi:hypothetical protein
MNGLPNLIWIRNLPKRSDVVSSHQTWLGLLVLTHNVMILVFLNVFDRAVET